MTNEAIEKMAKYLEKEAFTLEALATERRTLAADIRFGAKTESLTAMTDEAVDAVFRRVEKAAVGPGYFGSLRTADLQTLLRFARRGYALTRTASVDELVEAAKIAFWASLTNANAGMRWLDHDSMDEMIEAAWVGFDDALRSITKENIDG